MTKTPATLTPADLAAELGTDARTARKFLRSITPRDEQPGKGSRWAIKGTKTEIARLRKGFTAFQAAQDEARAKRAEAKAAEEATIEVDEVDEEPTAEELEALEVEEIDS